VIRAFASCAVASCALACAPILGRYDASGQPVWVDLDSIGDAVVPRMPTDLLVLRQASLDFHCAPGDMHVLDIDRGPESGGIWRFDGHQIFNVQGCGRGATYLDVRLWGATSSAPGHTGSSENVELRRFVDVSGDEVPATFALLDRQAASMALVDRPGRQYTRPRLGDSRIYILSEWAQLSRAGARELDCPRASLVLDVARTRRAVTYLAEGCGRRALFEWSADRKSLALVSKVAIAPPSP
jgi:hypothetical protein